MRIAYSCAGEGLGHAARLIALAPFLEERYEMIYFIPSHLRRFIRDTLPAGRFEDLPYFAFEKKQDRICWWSTAQKTIPQLLDFPRVVNSFAEKLKREQVQALISDYDPYLSWAGKMSGIPVFQMNHPGIISKTLVLNPLGWMPALTSLFLEGPWTERVHISFFYGDIGPLYRASLFKYPIDDQGYLLVYLKPSYREPVLQILQKNPNIRYRLFPSRGENFEEALSGCTAVLSSAGHQIIAEALALSKPILVIPQKGQWEQWLNARMLHRTGKGAWTSLSRLGKDLPRFMNELEKYRVPCPLPPGFTLEDGTKSLLERIDSFIQRNRVSVRAFQRTIQRSHPWKSTYPILDR
ncbi:MAG: hypothetical protein N2442_14555 [Spirochaetes bacterium]|nr:hypothetical protein [Spirochaetota bacterium]